LQWYQQGNLVLIILIVCIPFSSDPPGIEILSIISQNDKGLSHKLLSRFVEPPIRHTDRIEVIITEAKHITSLVDEDSLIQHLSKAFQTEKTVRNASIFLSYFSSNRNITDISFFVQSLQFCICTKNELVRTSGIIGLSNTFFEQKILKLKSTFLVKALNILFHQRCLVSPFSNSFLV
jgi:hypothetical protein